MGESLFTAEKAEEGGADPESVKVLELIESEAQRCGTIVRNLFRFMGAASSAMAEPKEKAGEDRHHEQRGEAYNQPGYRRWSRKSSRSGGRNR